MKNTKQLKIGIYTISVAAIAVVIAALVNMIVGMLPSKFTSFDTSGLNLHEITDETKEILSEVDTDITLYLVVEEGMQDVYVTQLLENYAYLNSKIKIKEVDPVLHPTFETSCGESYNLGDYSENTVIVSGPQRDKVVEYSEIFQTEYSEEEYYYYYYYGVEPTGTTSFYGEAKLTGAVSYVAGENAATVYTLTGHDETEFGTTLSGYISDDNYTTESLSLLTAGSVPEDASCVVINNPTVDLSSDEADAISAYINGGGRVILITSFNGTSITAFSNLCSLGSSYGINAMEGMIIEGDSNHSLSGYPYYLLPDVGSHTITEAISDRYALMPLAHGLSISNKEIEGVTHTALLTTSSSAYSTDGSTVSEADALNKGQMYVGVMAEVESGETSGSLVWYSSLGITEDSIDSYVSGGNSSLFLSTLSYVCEKEESVSIAAKSMAVESLTVPEGSANTWKIVLCILVPLAFIVPGFGYWIYRRKK